MDNNVTHSPSLHFFYFKIVAPNPGSAFYAVILSTSVVVSILSPLAVVANGLVLAAIWRNPSLRTPSYILLAGLAFTDFCTGLISQPIYVAKEMIYLFDTQLNTVESRPSFNIIRAFANCCATFFSNVTVIIITVMSIERWLHMTRRSMITVRRTCFIFLCSLFLPIPLVVYRGLNNIQGIYRLESDITSISSVLICLIGTSTAYFKVYEIIRRHQQQIHVNNMTQNVVQPTINFEKYKKSVLSILYILFVFYIGYIPVVIALGIQLVSNDSTLTVLLLNVSMVFVFLSAVLNPLLYLWRMNDIRNEVKQLVKRICRLDD